MPTEIAFTEAAENLDKISEVKFFSTIDVGELQSQMDLISCTILNNPVGAGSPTISNSHQPLK